MLSNWIFEDNLRPFLESVGWFVGYSFDESDWELVKQGVKNTDQETGVWFNFDISGSPLLHLRLACDPGSCVIHLQIEVQAAVQPKVEAALAIFQHYRVQ